MRPALAGTTITSLGITEPDTGSDVAAITTRAERDGTDYVVTGAKTYITSGMRADLVTTAVRTGGPGHRGVSLLVIETDRPGVSRSRLRKMGWHCSDTAELRFDAVRVPAANLVGPEGSGFGQIMTRFASERLSLSVQAYATAQRCLDLTLAWVRGRRTFGAPLAQRQLVRHQIAEMARQTTVARTYVRDVFARWEAGSTDDRHRERARHGQEHGGRRVRRRRRPRGPAARRHGLHARRRGRAPLPRRPHPGHRRRHDRDHERGRGGPAGAGPVSAPSVDELLADLDDERAAVMGLVRGIGRADWSRPTRATPWTVRDQVAHLGWFDGAFARAISTPDEFTAERDTITDLVGFVDAANAQVPEVGPAALAYWQDAARFFDDSARELEASDPSARLPWYGPPMSLRSAITSRIMETWAHGADVADALGVRLAPTDRLRHVADIAVRARPQGYRVRSLDVPATPVRVELTAPSGALWTWGPEDAGDRVAGDAEEFCLVLVRRVHVDDTAVTVSGDAAREWMTIGQAFAGTPGADPVRA